MTQNWKIWRKLRSISANPIAANIRYGAFPDCLTGSGAASFVA